MGKYMRKAKMTGDVAVMDFSQSSLGVRTRAKTLALQRLQATITTTPPPSENPELSYLQLRNRRLEKPPLQQSTCCRQHPEPKNPNPRANSRLRLSSGNSIDSVSICSLENKKEGFNFDDGAEDNNGDLGPEASFGENNLDFEGRERSTRESTPCSLIRDSNTVGTPGSSTKPRSLSDVNQIILNSIQRNMPTAHEIEEFFACAEQQQQRLFADKYNFDIVNDVPLVGRYEWVRVQP